MPQLAIRQITDWSRVDLGTHWAYSAGPAERGPNLAEGHPDNADPVRGVMAAPPSSPPCSVGAGPSKAAS